MKMETKNAFLLRWLLSHVTYEEYLQTQRVVLLNCLGVILLLHIYMALWSLSGSIFPTDV